MRPRTATLARPAAVLPLLLGAALLAACEGDDKTVVQQVQNEPFFSEWSTSGHADATAGAFTHWDDAGVVPTGCANCHSSTGFQDFVGADGSAAGTVEEAPAVGTTVDCEACHNDHAFALASVTFPSGVTIEQLGHEAICMQCHQGRESSDDVDQLIADAGVGDDTVSSALRFLNIHYLAAAATRFGGQTRGGYQYAGEQYDGVFPHVASADACTDCHDKHTLAVKVGLCATCHDGVTEHADLASIRMPGSFQDFDGDGDTDEGIAEEIGGLLSVLLGAMQTYTAASTTTDAIVYDGATYPYFFVDGDGDGVLDPGENSYGERYQTWTPRLVRAAYNYQYAQVDPGAYAHNAKYVIELLYDAIADLESHAGVTVPGFADLRRNDGGHFDPSSDAFRHFDEEEAVEPACARCHTPTGLITYLASGGSEPFTTEPLPEGLTCDACHTGSDFTESNAPLRFVGTVEFPGGAEVHTATFDSSFLCMTCHQGRNSSSTVAAAIAAGNLSFTSVNVHYLAAGGVQQGSQVALGYQYPGKTYAGRFDHVDGSIDGSSRCVYCHNDGHSFHVDPFDPDAGCIACHGATTPLEEYRLARSSDYDGDGDNTEPLVDEIHTLSPSSGTSLAALLYAQMQTYTGNGILYDGSSYPYFFEDDDNDGQPDPGEIGFGNRFQAWDAPLLRAAHNLQISQTEPGGWAHNTDYMAQILIDAIESLGGDVSASGLNLTRP